jgi:ADP-heptose:LPS heptosyltransferase
MTRPVEPLERLFRKKIVYPLLRVVFRNPEAKGPADLEHVGRILIFRYDRIGDMILTTPILRALKHFNPRLRLDVLASKENAEIVLNNPYVNNLMILEHGWWGLLKQVAHLRRQRYDVVLNFIFNRTTGPGILANIIAPHGHKVGSAAEHQAFYFNRIVRIRRFEQHMLESYVSMVEQAFGIAVDRKELQLEVAIDDGSRVAVDEWLKKVAIHRRAEKKSPGDPYVVLNPSGKDEDRSLAVQQVIPLVKKLSGTAEFRLVVLDSPGNPGMANALRGNVELGNALFYRTRTDRPLGELATLIKGSLLVISPDTSIVHFASAMHTPVLAIYSPLNASQEWMPINVTHEVVMANEDRRISEIEPKILVDRADRFINRILESHHALSPEPE